MHITKDRIKPYLKFQLKKWYFSEFLLLGDICAGWTAVEISTKQY